MKLVLRISLALLFLLFVILLVVLVPPHLQIRSVNTALPQASDFLSLRHAQGPKKIHYVLTSQQVVQDRVLTHSVFVLEWADGRYFLIDAGMRREEAEEFAKLMGAMGEAGDVEIHGDIAQLLGSVTQRVAGVGFTHLHIDHTEGLLALCDVQDLQPTLLQTQQQSQEHNFNTTEAAELIGESCLKQSSLQDGLIHTSEDFPGLGLVAVGGHTPGSTLFAAWLGDQLYLFSGDITNSKNDMLEDRGKGWLYSTVFVPEDTQRTASLRSWLRDLGSRENTTVVVSHDLGDIQRSGLTELSP